MPGVNIDAEYPGGLGHLKISIEFEIQYRPIVVNLI
jgi:hypothetical protein